MWLRWVGGDARFSSAQGTRSLEAFRLKGRLEAWDEVWGDRTSSEGPVATKGHAEVGGGTMTNLVTMETGIGAAGGQERW